MSSGMLEILIGKILLPFLAQLLPASLVGVSAATKAKNTGGFIGDDWNTYEEHNRS
jgi:hypothetical protein